MKTTLFVLLFAFAASAFAQEQTPTAALGAACGPLATRFDTEFSTSRPPTQPEPGKALVFVAEEFPAFPEQIGSPTLLVGLDGAWQGATHGNSFISFSVDPGEHHLCAKWQSHLAWLSRLISVAHLSAEAGKTYYFRTRGVDLRQFGTIYLDLDPVDTDKGQYLVATSQFISSHARK